MYSYADFESVSGLYTRQLSVFDYSLVELSIKAECQGAIGVDDSFRLFSVSIPAASCPVRPRVPVHPFSGIGRFDRTSRDC